MQPAELLLVWKHPMTRLRYVIGHLWRDADGYHFQHEHAMPRSFDAAVAVGFQPIPSLLGGSDGTSLLADHLFAAFQRRLPPRWRSDEYEKLGLTPEQDLEYLRATGGRVPTDTFEFLEPIQAGGQHGECRLHFPIAGWRYHHGERFIHELHEGTDLKLELDRENKFDPSAVKIFSPSGGMLGYVPAVYAWYVDESVASGLCRAVVDKIGPADDPQIRVEVLMTAATDEPIPFKAVPTAVLQYDDPTALA